MSNQKCYRAVGLCLLAVLAVAEMGSAASLHLIMFADTLDPQIGTQADLDRTETWGRTIAENTGLELKFQSLSGSQLTESRARNKLRALAPLVDDVVYFVYSGHGVNLGESKWPTFTFMTGSALDFEDVVSILQPKPQRLLIVLADCCNAPLSSGRLAPGIDPSGQNALTVSNFQNLFLNFRGNILVSSSSQDQYSLGGPDGGLFLNIFMTDFLELAGTRSDLTWEEILKVTAADVLDIASEYAETQRPQYEIKTEQVAAESPEPPVSEDPLDNPDVPPVDGDDDVEQDPNHAPACAPMSTPLLALSLFLLFVNRRCAATGRYRCSFAGRRRTARGSCR